MKKSDTIVDEIHEIRRRIYERTKNMNDIELADYFNESGRRSAEKYGFKIYKNVEEAERDRAAEPAGRKASKTPDAAAEAILAIRLRYYELTKEAPPPDLADYFNERAAEAERDRATV